MNCRSWTLVVVLGTCVSTAIAAAPREAKDTRVWRVAQDGSGDFNGRDEQPILQAVAKAGPAGGRIEIGPGEYTIRRPIVLRSNLTLRGHGATLRLPTPSVVSKPAAKGDTRLAIDDVSQFVAGTKLQIVPPVGVKTFAGVQKPLLVVIEQVAPAGIVLAAPLPCDVPASAPKDTGV